MNWAELLKANYDFKKPLTIAVPYRSGWKQLLADKETFAAFIKGEQK